MASRASLLKESHFQTLNFLNANKAISFLSFLKKGFFSEKSTCKVSAHYEGFSDAVNCFIYVLDNADIG